uniref:Multiprotein bridging factor type 1 n=1 Tax=Pfiesteria piscicida TaxID=71001 RepID=E8Z6J6_PFIPI|nr:multiprotein bridging factor type 1 [Pfiesteria piscicida]
MPCRPSLVVEQQWEPVVWQKAAPKGRSARSATEVNAARRQGADVETARKLSGGTNRALAVEPSAARKLEEQTEAFRHATVSHDFKMALQQARLAKGLSQSQLASQVNERASVINEYEGGKAIPGGSIVSKLNRALGVRLPRAK